MNYDQEIQKIVDAMKADKTILQPYKNYAAKAAEEVKAWIRMGKTTTLQRYESEPICTCPSPGVIAKDCLVHKRP